MRYLRWLVIFLVLVLPGCRRESGYEPRSFPTADSALAHWRANEREFRQTATEWQTSGGRVFFPYSESWSWNETYVRKTWWGLGPWRVTRPADLVKWEEKTFWSFE